MTNQEIVREYKDLLNEAIEEPGIIAECYSQFHNYSFANIMEVRWQCAMMGLEFGPIAGYKKWSEQGRQVQKGSEKLYIWFPVFGKYPSDDCKECNAHREDHDGTYHEFVPVWKKYIKGFAYKKGVFVISQTDGEEIELPNTPEWDTDQALENLKIEQIEFSHGDGNVQGLAEKGRKVAVSPLAQHPIRTLVHEIAHVQLGHVDSGYWVDEKVIKRSDQEIEAESVAYLISYALGLPGASESRGYIQGWMDDGFTFTEEMSQRIFGAVNKILMAGRVYA